MQAETLHTPDHWGLVERSGIEIVQISIFLILTNRFDRGLFL